MSFEADKEPEPDQKVQTFIDGHMGDTSAKLQYSKRIHSAIDEIQALFGLSDLPEQALHGDGVEPEGLEDQSEEEKSEEDFPTGDGCGSEDLC